MQIKQIVIYMKLEAIQETRNRPINIKISFQVRHWPTLKTVLIVEDAIRTADKPLSIEALKRKLEKKIMDQTLRLILAYLEDQGSIVIGEKGIAWIRNDSPKFLEMLKKTKRIEV